MKRVPIAEFKAHLSRYVEEASREDIVITKHGKAVARVVAETEPSGSIWDFYGASRGRVYVNPDDDLLSTGREWDAAKPGKKSFWDFYGALPDIRVDPDDDLLSTGMRWDAESPAGGTASSGQNF